MDTIDSPIFSRTLKTGGRASLFLDVYKRGGKFYLSICENRMDGDGNFQRIRIYVSREGIAGMRDALDEVNNFLDSLGR